LSNVFPRGRCHRAGVPSQQGRGGPPPPRVSRPSSRSLRLGDGARRTAATQMVSSSGAASHLLATHTLSSPVLHRLLRDETAVSAVGVAGGPANVDAKIAAFCPPQILQPLAQGRNACLSVRIVRSQHQYGDVPHTLALLRAARKGPCGRVAAEQRDEVASLHSITSSARASSDGETSSPSTLAVVMLIMKSNLVGCSTGRSLGFAPRRILSTY